MAEVALPLPPLPPAPPYAPEELALSVGVPGLLAVAFPPAVPLVPGLPAVPFMPALPVCVTAEAKAAGAAGKIAAAAKSMAPSSRCRRDVRTDKRTGIENLPSLKPWFSTTYINWSAAWDSPKPAHQQSSQKSQVYQACLRFLPKVKIPSPLRANNAIVAGSGTET